jgi:threonine dehydrogenase-like Zn-dependent dehydrogenase
MMRAMVYTKPGTLELLDVDEPVTKEGEVIVEVEACGICGSELHGIAQPGFRQPPLIMGHEFSGRDPKGRAVAVNPIISCGKCDLCVSGRNEVCRYRSVVGIHRRGAFAERVGVPESQIYELTASGGGSWVAASHATAAVRMARSLLTPTPTPVAMAQLSASAQDERRSAGTGGSEAWRSSFQPCSSSRRVTKAASAPAP